MIGLLVRVSSVSVKDDWRLALNATPEDVPAERRWLGISAAQSVSLFGAFVTFLSALWGWAAQIEIGAVIVVVGIGWEAWLLLRRLHYYRTSCPKPTLAPRWRGHPLRRNP